MLPHNTLQKCLFLDRDGVINTDTAYAYQVEDITFLPGIFELCYAAQENGYLIIVVTNQSGIARGIYTEEQFFTLTRWIEAQFLQKGITITATYHCPHHPELTGECLCRKPAPGMLLEAIKKYPIAAQFSMMIGDKPSDMEAASAAGIGTRILFSAGKKQHSDQASLSIDTLAAIIPLLTTEPIP